MNTPPPMPVEANGPHGYKSWSRRKKILVWPGGVLAALFIIGSISNAVSPPKPAPASHVTQSTPAPKTQAPQAAAPKVAAPQVAAPKVAAEPAPHKTTASAKPSAVATPAPASPAPVAPAAAAGPSCTMQMQAWGEANDATFTALKNDEGQVASDASLVAGDVATGNVAQVDIDNGTLGTDAAQLGSDVSTAQDSPPPTCASAFSPAYNTALSYYSQSASAMQDASQDIATGDYSDATGSLAIANTAETSANTSLSTAVSDLQAYGS